MIHVFMDFLSNMICIYIDSKLTESVSDVFIINKSFFLFFSILSHFFYVRTKNVKKKLQLIFTNVYVQASSIMRQIIFCPFDEFIA